MAKKAVKVVRKLVMVVGPHRGGGFTASRIKAMLRELKVSFNEFVDGEPNAGFYQGTARSLFSGTFEVSSLPQLFVLEQTNIEGEPEGDVVMVSALSAPTMDKALTLCRVFFGVKWSVVPEAMGSSEDEIHAS